MEESRTSREKLVLWKAVILEQTTDLMEGPANTVKNMNIQLKTVGRTRKTKMIASFVRSGDKTSPHVGFEKNTTKDDVQGASKRKLTLFGLMKRRQLVWNIQKSCISSKKEVGKLFPNSVNYVGK